jgi:uncharacterized membrane protein
MWTQLNVSTTEEAQTTEQPVILPNPYDPLRDRRGVMKAPAGGARTKIILSAATIIALWYITTSVMKYLHVTRETYGIFWPRHEWLFAHVVAGTIAVVFGPVQFWLGLKREQAMLHRTLGITYVGCTAIGAISAIYLAFHTVYGWIFGAGLTAMALAWIITTGMATMAICKGMVSLHRQWMIRSYLMTFGFVLFRFTTDILEMGNVGTMAERLAFASWACWTIPLLAVEGFSQGRKLWAPKTSLGEAGE